MFEFLLDMYIGGRITPKYLRKAVKAGWITEEEYEEIIEAKEKLQEEGKNK